MINMVGNRPSDVSAQCRSKQSNVGIDVLNEIDLAIPDNEIKQR